MKDYDYILLLNFISILADGKFHSNKQLSKQLGVNQVLIDKYVQILYNLGLDIFPVSGKGYSLPQSIQLLDEKFICNQIKTTNVKILSVVDSTNQYLLNNLLKLRSGDVCIAEYQQEGRGRRGHKWFSPFGANLYLSMYWSLNKGPAAVVGLSLMIGIVVAEVLQNFGVWQVRLKWPNDLYLQGRKLAGILIEFTGKTGSTAQLVIGTGINLTMHNMHEVVNKYWISLQEVQVKIDRNILAIELIKNLRISLSLFEREGLTPFLPRWERLDNFINQPVKLIIDDKAVVYGVSRGINAHGALLLEQNGAIKPWIDSNISLRGLE